MSHTDEGFMTRMRKSHVRRVSSWVSYACEFVGVIWMSHTHSCPACKLVGVIIW